MNSYIFDNAVEVEAAERFARLDALYNFRTFRFRETAGIGPCWRCLEVAAGAAQPSARSWSRALDVSFWHPFSVRNRRVEVCCSGYNDRRRGRGRVVNVPRN
jgi:hypothetical protein